MKENSLLQRLQSRIMYKELADMGIMLTSTDAQLRIGILEFSLDTKFAFDNGLDLMTRKNKTKCGVEIALYTSDGKIADRAYDGAPVTVDNAFHIFAKTEKNTDFDEI